MSTNSIVIKSGKWYTFTNILLKSTALVSAPIFTRLLSTEDYGIVANFNAWLGLGLLIVGLGLPYSIGPAKIDYPLKFKEFIASIQALGSITSLVFAIIGIVMIKSLIKWTGLENKMIIIIAIYLIFYPSLLYTLELLKFTFRYKQNISISIFNTFGSIVFGLIFVLLLNNEKYLGRILGLIFPMFIMGIIFYIKIFYQGWSKDIGKYWSYALKISIPMIPHSLAMLVLGQIDRVMIVKYVGYSEAGLYSFGYTYAILLSLFSNAVLQAYKPWLYENYSNNKLIKIVKSNRIIGLGICIISFTIIAFAPEAIKILSARHFWDSKWIVMPIATGILFQYIYNSYSSLELYHKKTYVIAIGSMLAAIINFILNGYFIPQYGYIAAAYTTLLSYFTLAIFHLIAYKIICKKRVYDDKYVWLTVFVFAFLSFIILQLYDFYWARYSFFTMILVATSVFQWSKIKIIVDVVFGFSKSSVKSND